MKPVTRVKSNSAAIVAAMIERGMSREDVARACNINVYRLSRIISADRPIHYKTAAKLVKAFGTDAVTITEPAQI